MRDRFRIALYGDSPLLASWGVVLSWQVGMVVDTLPLSAPTTIYDGRMYDLLLMDEGALAVSGSRWTVRYAETLALITPSSAGELRWLVPPAPHLRAALSQVIKQRTSRKNRSAQVEPYHPSLEHLYSQSSLAHHLVAVLSVLEEPPDHHTLRWVVGRVHHLMEQFIPNRHDPLLAGLLDQLATALAAGGHEYAVDGESGPLIIQ